MRPEDVVDALLQQSGIQRFRSGEELFDAAEFFERQPLPAGRRIAVITNSAGAATLAVDACGSRGLAIGRVADELVNPLVLSLGARPEVYAQGARRLLEDPGVDALMAFYVDPLGGDPSGVMQAIAASRSDGGKPVVACVVTAEGQFPTDNGAGVPNFRFPESCAGVLARAASRREWLSRPVGEQPSFKDVDAAGARELIEVVLAGQSANGSWLSGADAEALLSSHGIAVVEARHCEDVRSAEIAAAEIGGPVAMKASFAPPGHPADIDAVLLGLDGEAAVRGGWQELERRVRVAERPWTGALVQRLEAPGADVLIGTLTDPELGRVMAVGLGGRQAGLGGTVAFRLPLVTDVDADELIDASEAVTSQLEGFRGNPPLDRDALRELLLRFALLLREVPEIVEADLNPVRCKASGCSVLDMRLQLGSARPSERIKTW